MSTQPGTSTALDTLPASPAQTKLAQAVRGFDRFLRVNAEEFPNYRQRRQDGKPISTAFAESAVNQIVSKRMVKKQQMRWTPRGAHLLLQVRIRALNNQLASDFHRWYPDFHRPHHLALTA